jgi:TPR repeat protein
MRILLFTALLLACLAACTSDGKTELFECEQQHQGEACNKLGKAREGAEALRYFRKGCDLGNTNSCVSLAEHTTDRNEALTVLKSSCDKGNTTACAKYAEKATEKP